MNQLFLSIEDAKDEAGSAYRAVTILVDGVSLIELVRGAESPFARREGQPQLAGAYAWLPATADTWRALIPRSIEEDEKEALLDCACGLSGCWPLLARVTQDASSVRWGDFEQPHRDEESAAGHWSYEGFGPFIFSRDQYERELAKLGSL